MNDHLFAELQAKVENLISDLALLRQEKKRLESENRELIEKRDLTRRELDRIVSRLDWLERR